MVAVAFPEAESVVVEKDESAYPLDAFPSIEMRNDEAKRAAMLAGERLAVMLEREENIGLQQIFEWHVGGVAFFARELRRMRARALA